VRGYSELATRQADLLDLVSAVVAGGLVILAETDRPGVPRILLSLAFLFFVPGRAIVSNWPQLARWSQAGMSMVISLTVLALLAVVTLWAHEWHPLGLLAAEAVASIGGLVLGTLRRHGRTAQTPMRRTAR
jgi:uncharacterized membrane protein